MENLTKFQQLLRQLFQFDCQDLDFGIYRVLNYKRRQVEEFINDRLPKIVDGAFAQYAAANRKEVERELEAKRHEIEDTARKLGQQAFDTTGHLGMAFRETPLGKQFIELEQKAQVGRVADELKASVYNDLYTFFSRYYEDGDIFSKPRRGKVEIPFTGHEDVVLHWANKDQYYIKTGEQFKSYRFKADKTAVQFALQNVSTEQNNNQGEKRYFVLGEESPIDFDNKTKTLTVSFKYRPLTDPEKKTYGKTENQKPQDKLNAVAEEAILKRVKDATLKVRLAQTVGEGKPSLLLYHLNRFTKKNSTDFFIHKNLRGFLGRELEDFLKTEVLRVDELLAGNPADLDRHLRRGQVVRTVAIDIIDFLSQVEDFQKRLFEKRKFVVRTEYCITVDRLPEPLWDEVLKNKAQLEEWQQLYTLRKKEPDKKFLKEHKTLMVDTRHFPENFKWRLLAAFDDLDVALDGVLIKSENFQALALLLAKYRERVRCVYIDPPYNTGTDEFIYKDNYQHSCWLTMLGDRLRLAAGFIQEQGVLLVSIDEIEQPNLQLILDQIYGRENSVATFVWEGGRKNDSKLVSISHEYILCYAKSADSLKRANITWGVRKEGIDDIYKKVESLKRVHGRNYKKISNALAEWLDGLPDNHAAKRHSQYWAVDQRGVYFPSDIGWHGGGGPKYRVLHPDTKKACKVPERGWMYPTPERMKEAIEQRLVHFGDDHTTVPNAKAYLKDNEYEVLNSVFYRDRRGASKRLRSFLGRAVSGRDVFENPKDELLLARLMQPIVKDGELAFDFFGGSGSTAHAVTVMNQQGGGRRKYLMVEMGDWFEGVMLPRLKKLAFSDLWKDGEPADGKAISQFVKYCTLEQYEDTLNNLALVRAKDAELALKTFGDEYLLRYMLDFETAGSASLLAVQRLRHPFGYTLKVQDGDETAEHTVDLVETFNYLLGLHVKKLREFRDGKRVYRVTLGETRNGKSLVVVWRDLEGLEDKKDQLQKDCQFIETEILPVLLGRNKRPDRLLVNGTCVVEGVEPIEPEFKRLMFAPIG